MNILAFAASNSRQSINKRLVSYSAELLEGGLIEGAAVEVIDLNDFEMPIYSIDRENEIGIPTQAHAFYKKIGAADAVIISFAEHNGSYSAAYKNLFDWTSRIDMKVYQNKPVALLATSPGPGGAGSVLAAAKGSAPYFGIDLRSSLSVSSFYDHFDGEQNRIKTDEVRQQLEQALVLLNN